MADRTHTLHDATNCERLCSIFVPMNSPQKFSRFVLVILGTSLHGGDGAALAFTSSREKLGGKSAKLLRFTVRTGRVRSD